MSIIWKWSNGEVYYKSARQQPQVQIEQVSTYNSQENAINQSLEDQSFFNNDAESINITNSIFTRTHNVSGTRREDIDPQMSERETIAQRGFNPFLQTSYVNDIVAHDMFLKPVNTTFERAKENKQKEE